MWTPGPYRTHGVAIFDYDNDGDNDVMVGNGGFFDDQREPDRFWRNDTPCTWHWVKLRLREPGLNTTAIGAEVEVRDADGWAVYRRHSLAGGFTSSQPDILHVGMGDHPGPYTVTVRWPTGEEDVYPAIEGEALTTLTAG